MYYEEKVINGVISWRNTPNGEWKQKTPEELTEKIRDLESKIRMMNA